MKKLKRTIGEYSKRGSFDLQSILLAINVKAGKNFSPKIIDGELRIGKVKIPNLYKEKGAIDTEELVINLRLPIEYQHHFIETLKYYFNS